MKEISILDMDGFTIAQAEDVHAATGVTVVLAAEGMAASIDVRGGGPASRDSRILDPLAAAESIHAVVLAGGSAFGLDAASGVQQYLEEQGYGLDVGVAKVPLVCQSDIFDLGVGSASVRPGREMGYAAACVAGALAASAPATSAPAADVSAERLAGASAADSAISVGPYRDGNFGAGCGASVGKIAGMERSMKSGIGSYAVQVGELQVAAIVVVNALGDVYDPESGKRLAGVLAPDGSSFADTREIMCEYYLQASRGGMQADSSQGQEASNSVQQSQAKPYATNTTIGAIITNAGLSKAHLCKVAGMAHDGMARSVRPVHMSMDGDSVYALSVGKVSADQDIVGALAADVMACAIVRAIKAAKPAYGLKAACDFC